MEKSLRFWQSLLLIAVTTCSQKVKFLKEDIPEGLVHFGFITNPLKCMQASIWSNYFHFCVYTAQHLALASALSFRWLALALYECSTYKMYIGNERPYHHLTRKDISDDSCISLCRSYCWPEILGRGRHESLWANYVDVVFE